MSRIVVLGAGMAGTSAALELAEELPDGARHREAEAHMTRADGASGGGATGGTRGRRTAAPRVAPAVLAAMLAVSAAGEPMKVPLETIAAAWQFAPQERIWDGTVEAVKQATVSAQTSGRVAEILYDVNDFVEAGATIMRFTDVEQQAELRRAKAALVEAEARFAEAEQEFERISSMFRRQSVSRSQYEQAQANRDAAAARLEAARSSVAAAEEQLEYTEVKAPYAGIVSARHVELGEMVAPGQPLMSGLSLEALRINVDVPQSMIQPIREIGRAWVYVGDARIAAENLTFFPVADPAANTFRVRVNLPEGSATLFPGMFVKVGFVVGEARRLLIPAGAVVRRSELSAVYVVDAARVMLRQVRLGRRYGDDIEVLAGLDSGEHVAVDPVRAGIYVKQQQAASRDEG